tara:strand:+ start:148 stop:675 length:528 start_codon:yes stop_codon:yes gene_type:complete
MEFSIIVATDNVGGIGYYDKNKNKYTIPWKNSEDMLFFKKITTGDKENAVIMGRNTYLSIGKELPNRKNIIISKTLQDSNLTIFPNLDQALEYCNKINVSKTFVIGGSCLYEEAIKHIKAKEIFWNVISETKNICNINFPYSIDEIKEHDNWNLIKHTPKNKESNVDYYILKRKS